METVILILEILGSVAFAISGCQVAVKHRMDLLGVFVLGITTAVGGGVIRDLLLDQVPPAMFVDPTCALAALGVCVAICIRPIRTFLFNDVIIMRIADSIGLGIFTAIGTAKALSIFPENYFLAAFVGVITGVGGGILRDVFANEPPYVFVRHIYALASLFGAILYILLSKAVSPTAGVIVCSCAVILIRLLAGHFRWKLPVLEY
ncbi:MAG: TRIC cation channel family protein [Lachnospiraceae bacterium]|nr:TRIC cation channel family protein [Lachnospiraceae bacterium]